MNHISTDIAVLTIEGGTLIFKFLQSDNMAIVVNSWQTVFYFNSHTLNALLHKILWKSEIVKKSIEMQAYSLR